MRVFVTGATGFVGSAVVPELIQAGHQVIGLARSDASAAALEAAGAEVQRGSLEDLESLRRGAESADGVIHCAFIHDFANFEASCAADRRAIGVFGAVLAGSGRPLVITSGTGLLAPGRIATERDLTGVGPVAHARGQSETLALALAAEGVRVAVLRLPPTTHGEGDHGFMPAIIGAARTAGSAIYVGDGAGRWPAVHRHDAATLFRLALERAPAGSVLHAVDDEGVPTRQIAGVIARHLEVAAESVAPELATGRLGLIGTIFGMDIPASSALTREPLGWEPVHPGLIDDLEQGHYFQEVPVAG